MQLSGPISDFKTKGVAYIPYPDQLRTSVEAAIESWRLFCQEPEAVKLRFPYNSSEYMGVGYEMKKTPGANLDLKEDFHITPAVQDWIETTARVLHNEAVIAFSEKTREMIDLMQPLILDFARKLESEFGLVDLADEVATSKDAWFIRFLHYFGDRNVGDEIATPHADKSGFTLHLYESDPGLQYLTFKKQWRDMPVSAYETAIIPGMRMQYRSENQIKAIYHRVIATQKTAAQGRFSAVCFVHLNRTPAYDKQRAGRLQEFQPGFNYDMSFEEIAKLFKA